MGEPWPLVPLGEVLVHRKQIVQIDDTQEYRRCRVQLHAQGVVLRDVIPGAEIKTKSQQVCRAGEFLVAEIDAKLGGYGLVPDALDGAIVSSHYFLFDIDGSRLDRRYLSWFSKTQAFFEQVAAQGSTNYAAIRPAHVLRYMIPLPPIEEQRRIVARVEVIAAKVEDVQQLRRGANDEAAALIERYAAGIRSNLLASSHPSAVGEFTRVSSGATPDRHDTRYWVGGDVPWVKTGELRDAEIFHAAEAITETAVRETSAKVLPPGTLLVAMYGQGQTRGRTALLRIPAATNQACAAVHPSPHHVPEYLQWWFRSLYTELRAESRDGAQPNWNARMVKSVRIALPPIEEQHRVVQELEHVQHHVKRLVAQQGAAATELDALLPAVLNRAFRGEL